MQNCKHEKLTGKKRCGLSDPKRFYRLCMDCGVVFFGSDKKKKRERLDA